MLIFKDKKFIKSPFDKEVELEKVIIDNYEYLFGPDSFYLPKTKIQTANGAGTFPDGFAIDLKQKQWYIVEVELGHHPVWGHIAEQVSKQIAASKQEKTKNKIEELSVDLYCKNEYTKEKFTTNGISEVHVRKAIRDILEKSSLIAIPIDKNTDDLESWAKQQKHTVYIWEIKKYVEWNNPANIFYEFPDEGERVFDTEKGSQQQKTNKNFARYGVGILDLINADLIKPSDKIVMTYTPRQGKQIKEKAVVLDDGSIELLGQKYISPSDAALAGVQKTGSKRQTVNGWVVWKTTGGKTLSALREELLNTVSKTPKEIEQYDGNEKQDLPSGNNKRKEQKKLKAKEKVSVIFPDKTKICERKVSETFVKTILKIGPEKIKGLNIIRSGVPLVSEKKDKKYSQHQLGSYWIMVNTSTPDKIKTLIEINQKLKLKLNIETFINN